MNFEVLGTRAFHRPSGVMRLADAVERVAQALQQARALELEDILVNTTGLAGFDAPCIFERYAMITRWVQCAGMSLRIAIVARPSFIDYQKIGMVMAHNRGVSADVFADEPSALKWLETRRARARVRWPACGRAAGY